MLLDAFTQTPVFNWVIMPLGIFLARVCDVSIGTIRIIFISKGQKFLAPILGFFEVLIWLMAIRQVFLNLTNVACYFGFAAGFATGNFVGMVLEERLAMGSEVIRIIAKSGVEPLINYFKNNGYGVTRIEAEGTTGQVSIIFSIFNRRYRYKIIEDIRQLSPKAFYTIEDVRAVREGVFPVEKNRFWKFLVGRR